MAQKLIALMAALAIVSQEAALAQQLPPVLKQKRAELAWSELAAILTEKKISTRLPDGVKLEGQVLAVRPESLVMDVRKTSNGRIHPKGQSEIARESVKEVRVVRDSGPVKAAGGVGSGVATAAATSYAAVLIDSAALAVTGLVVLVPIAIIAGYYAGKAADRRTTRIIIRQDGE